MTKVLQPFTDLQGPAGSVYLKGQDFAPEYPVSDERRAFLVAGGYIEAEPATKEPAKAPAKKA